MNKNQKIDKIKEIIGLYGSIELHELGQNNIVYNECGTGAYDQITALMKNMVWIEGFENFETNFEGVLPYANLPDKVIDKIYQFALDYDNRYNLQASTNDNFIVINGSFKKHEFYHILDLIETYKQAGYKFVRHERTDTKDTVKINYKLVK